MPNSYSKAKVEMLEVQELIALLLNPYKFQA